MAMDDTLAVAAVDLSGRVAYVVDDKVKVRLVGDFQSVSCWRISLMGLLVALWRMCM